MNLNQEPAKQSTESPQVYNSMAAAFFNSPKRRQSSRCDPSPKGVKVLDSRQMASLFRSLGQTCQFPSIVAGVRLSLPRRWEPLMSFNLLSMSSITQTCWQKPGVECYICSASTAQAAQDTTATLNCLLCRRSSLPWPGNWTHRVYRRQMDFHSISWQVKVSESSYLFFLFCKRKVVFPQLFELLGRKNFFWANFVYLYLYCLKKFVPGYVKASILCSSFQVFPALGTQR